MRYSSSAPSILFIAGLIDIKVKMSMVGGPSELKVADEEVQKICDEVC